MNDVCEVRVTTLCFSMDTVPHSTLHTCTHSHSQHTTVHAHTQCPHPSPHTLHQDCMNACMHTCVPLEVGVAGRGWGEERGGHGRKGSGGRREEEGSCPYLYLYLDLQVGPVDGEQRAVRAGGAQLPGTVGHVPVAVSQEDQRGEGGDLAGEGALVCRGGHRGLHFRGRPHTHISLPHFVSGVCSWFTHPTHPSHSTHPHSHLTQPTPLTPPTPTLTPPTPMLTPHTHVHVHSQYTVGGPVLVQLVPTSHFGLRVEQEVIRKPGDNQWTTATHTANNGFIHIHHTIQHICTIKMFSRLSFTYVLVTTCFQWCTVFTALSLVQAVHCLDAGSCS